MTMDSKDKKQKNRAVVRRREDLQARWHMDRFKALFVLGKTITSEICLNDLFLLINEKTNQIMKTERSTVFLFDEKTDALWSFVATGMGKNEIRMAADKGIAGWVFQNQKTVLSNHAYSDPRFNQSIDAASGFLTKNILAIPLMNRGNECIGVLQVLNSLSGKFSKADEAFLNAISDYVAIALENAKLYRDVKIYAEDLKKAIILNESLKKLKDQLTKFVPPSVAQLAEQAPEKLDKAKIPMEVSVLFVDVAGFSRITEAYDQELVNHMIENHFSSYLSCVQKYGGEVNETSGDGVMVIFKSDTVANHERQAVRAGLEIAKENKRMNQLFDYPWGEVTLHIGISSGQGYVGTTRMKSSVGERWTYTASGLVTVLASRIGSVSENSNLYVGTDTYHKVDRLCVSECIGSLKLKNVSKEMIIYWIKEMMTEPMP
ncbi:MAG: GAF domain-containing protein [Proteobacteria bacterium]|nr:GAF domain-containing protein [Pseudomonadota bacterium]